MTTYILLHCAAVLATISLALSFAIYSSGEPVNVRPNHLVEYPVAQPTHLTNPTLIGPKIPMKAAYVANPTDMKTEGCKQ